ncbi:hypothetical protein FB564_0013 [Salinispora arenicola]|uniref:Uncharacterized protein n=1 Tax=Salinispora arenicola TaxID=168697 RepID=A0A542XGN6_SALAC|nr:hypothetical protein FB564_0013 [Salinispora arenicola]
MQVTRDRATAGLTAEGPATNEGHQATWMEPAGSGRGSRWRGARLRASTSSTSALGRSGRSDRRRDAVVGPATASHRSTTTASSTTAAALTQLDQPRRFRRIDARGHIRHLDNTVLFRRIPTPPKSTAGMRAGPTATRQAVSSARPATTPPSASAPASDGAQGRSSPASTGRRRPATTPPPARPSGSTPAATGSAAARTAGIRLWSRPPAWGSARRRARRGSCGRR